MTLQTIPGGLWLPRPTLGAIREFGQSNPLAFDDTGEKLAAVIQAPKAGNVAKICFRTGTVVTNGWVLTATLEGVTLATGYPDGSNVGGHTAGTQGIDGTDDNKWFSVAINAGDPATVTKDQLIAAVLECTTDPGSGSCVVSGFADERNLSWPYLCTHTGAWAMVVETSRPIIALEYSDGSYAPIPGCWPYTIAATDQFNSGDDPNHRGNRFQLPCPIRVAGPWVHTDHVNDYDVVLIDSDGTTVLATASLDKDVKAGTTYWCRMLIFDNSPVLKKDTNYWLAVKPGASDVKSQKLTVDSPALMDAYSLGQNMIYATANNPASIADWTMTNTMRAVMGLWIDAFDDGVKGAWET